MSSLLTNVKRSNWIEHGYSLKKKKYEPSNSELLPINIIFENFYLYQTGCYKYPQHYLLSVKNLDFDRLIKLRLQLFIEYGQAFLYDELFEEINYRIHYLQDYASESFISQLKELGELELIEKKKLFTTKMRRNRNKLDFIKASKIRALNWGQNTVLFNKTFYTYDEIYVKVLQYIEFQLSLYQFKVLKKVESKKTLEQSVSSETHQQKQIEKLKPKKSFQFIHNVFLYLSQKNALEIDAEMLPVFIYKLFDFDNSEYDNTEIVYKINITNTAWGIIFYDLSINCFHYKSQSQIWEILYEHKFIGTEGKIISQSSYKAGFTEERRKSAIRNNNYVSLEQILDMKM